MKLWHLGLAVVVAALAAAGVQTCRLQAARYDAWAADTARTNTLARTSTTERALRREGDSVRLVNSRLVEQGSVELAGATAEAAGARREAATARGRITLLQDSVALLRQRSATTRPEEGGTVTLLAADSTDTLGVQIRATVEVAGLPLPAGFQPGPILWGWRIHRPAIALDLALTCVERQARAHVSGPPGLPLELTELKQDERVCAPAPSAIGWKALSLELPSLPWAAALLAVGAVVGWSAHP